MSFTIEKDHYIVANTTPCVIIADNDKVTSKIWLRTPALDKSLIDKIVQIQLETKSRDQGWVSAPDAGSWSWFDIIVLDSPEASDIKVKDGLALAWLSHDNVLGKKEYTEQTGPAFGGKHDIFNGLEVGNALGVRVCAQFPGWENHASEGRLILRVSEKGSERLALHNPIVDGVNFQGRHAQPSPDEEKAAYLGVVTEQISKLGETFDTYLSAATPADAPPAYSLVREMLPTGPLRADQKAIAEEPPLRLLSFDGGGVRGISSLYILKAIMAKLSSDPNVKPCKYFDMIAGTSTGGLIAIMLGRLQMTIPECIEVYTTLASQIFSATGPEKIWNFANTGAYYTKNNFEKGLKDLIRKKTGDENAPMLDPDTNNQCKVFVVSGQSQDLNHTSAEQFRTYATKFPDAFAGCAIWEAARATSAAPTYLPAIQINGVEFVDGGLKFNNPSILLMGEVNAVFGIARHIDCLLTIGTGMQPNNAIDLQPTNPLEVPDYVASVAKAAINVATDCENTHQLAQTLFTGRDGVYFRFNAGVRQGNDWAPMIPLDDWRGMPKLVAITQTYIGTQTKRVDACAAALAS